VYRNEEAEVDLLFYSHDRNHEENGIEGPDSLDNLGEEYSLSCTLCQDGGEGSHNEDLLCSDWARSHHDKVEGLSVAVEDTWKVGCGR